jgi:hypothetical protein
MKEIKIRMRTTRGISSKLALVKHIKEDTGLGLKESKWIADDIMNEPKKWFTFDLPKHFTKRAKFYKQEYGIEIGGSFQEKLTSILDGEVILNDTIEKFESFLNNIDEKDAVAKDIFNNILPMLKDKPFDLKDYIRELKTKIELNDI